MSLATKNVATVLVGSVLVLAASFAVATPAKADLLSDLQAQVQALLAQISALQGGSTTTGGTGAGCYPFTMTHQMGDTGGEVMEIQKFLNSHGAMVASTGAGSPGNESSYYGALTRAAVAKWQAANGVAPAAGYWGPITRAKVAQVCASMPTTPTTPGVPTSQGLNGTAGTATFQATSEDVEDTVQTGTTEKVGAFKVEAQGSDIRVTSVRVTMTKTSAGSATDYLTAYFGEISIWANGTKIGSLPASSFTRDAAGVYSAVIPVDQIIRMGASNEALFHVGATANVTVDSDDISTGNTWTLTVTQVRYTDAVGAILFDNPSALTPAVGTNSGIEVERLSQSSEVTLRMNDGSGNPKAGNVEVNESNSSEVTLLEFTLRAEGTDMNFDQVKARITSTGVDQMGDIVQTFFLNRGSTRVAEVTPTTGDATTSKEYTFSLNDLENLPVGSTQTYRLVAKVNSIATTSGSATAFDQGDSLLASTSPSTGDINARASDGKIVTDRAGSVTGYTQTLRSEGIMITKVSESYTHNAQETSASSTGEYKVTLRITAFGSEDVFVPLSAAATTSPTLAASETEGVVYGMQNSGTASNASVATGAAATLARISGGTELTNSVRISAGSSADFQLTVVFNPDTGGTQGWRVQVWSAGHAATDVAAATSQTATVPVENFRSQYYTVNN